ncbi:hypothetical protein [Arthrobacter sp. L77]|uniref:hypothetical protein n=1 Tax=Arthrobacter sp. L77 TaxID=1496689 RepID=UPI0005BC5838|nr:hypothetical protein [Arthrobacter sp. L77]
MALLDGIAIARATETERMTSQRAQHIISTVLGRRAPPTEAAPEPCLWMSVLTAAFVAASSAPASLVLLGAIAGLGMGGGRRPCRGPPGDRPDHTSRGDPLRAVPRDQASSLLRGTDTTVLAMVPVPVALYLGTVRPGLVLARIVASSIALTVQAWTPASR